MRRWKGVEDVKYITKVWNRRFLSIWLSIALIMGVFINVPMRAEAAVNKTANQAISWLRSVENKMVRNGQCVALTQEYLHQIGISNPGQIVTADDYADRTDIPKGIIKLQGVTPKIGDILIYKNNLGGPSHAAIYESDYRVWHQNYNNKLFVTCETKHKYNDPNGLRKGQYYWGVWRPQFLGSSDTPITATFETYGTGGSRGNVSDTNATLYTVVYTNARANISIGLRIGTEKGNWNLKTHEEALSNSGYNQLNRQGNFEAWFDCNSELGISFTSGTTYWYQYYVKIDGKEYADEARTFKTKGTAPDKQKPTVSNLKITEVSKDGYRVTVNVSDNVGVMVVKFPTWISGSSNVKWLEGTVNGTTATCYIKASDFTNNSADFVTDVYAYDAADNVSEPIRGTVFIDRTESSPSGSEENDTDKTIRVEGVHDVTYNGKDQKFDLSVYEGNHLLINGLDYNVNYKNNRNAGTGSVIVNVKGIKESYTKNFTISPLDISGENFRVSNTSKRYKAGKSYKLTTKLFRNEVELVKDKDYTYLEGYQNETGIYNIVISGKGNYTGTRIATYEITDKPLISNAKVSGFKDFFNYTGFAKEQTFMVLKYKGKTLSEGKDYNVRYENNTSVGVAYVYIMGVGEFGGEFRKSFRIIGKDMSRVKATVKSTTYDGMAKKPNIVLKYGNTRLAEGRDYDVRYEKNINAGTGKAIVTFKGAYTGTKKYSFTINRAKIKKDDVNCDGSVYLTMENGKKVANAKVSVYFNGKKLIAGRDYVVKYSGGTKVGKTRTVTISGRGNFRGSVTKTFKVIG